MIKNYQNLSLLEENFQKHGSIFKRIVQKQFETFGASWAQEFDQVLGIKVLPTGLVGPVKAYADFSLGQCDYSKNLILLENINL